MKIIQHIKQNTCTLLVIVWGCSITGCRDLKDSRTPYKSFVVITCSPINKDDTATTDPAILEILRKYPPNTFFEKPLEPDKDSVIINLIPSDSDTGYTLTIHYQKEAVLISHQCGGTYKYTLKEITSTFEGKYKILNKELSTLNDSDIDVQIYL